jgi:hypothetical protein
VRDIRDGGYTICYLPDASHWIPQNQPERAPRYLDVQVISKDYGFIYKGAF